MNSESAVPPGVHVSIVKAPELPVSNRTTNVASGAIIGGLEKKSNI